MKRVLQARVVVGPDTTPDEMFELITMNIIGPLLQNASDKRVEALAGALIDAACSTMSVLELPPGQILERLRPLLERSAAECDKANEDEKKSRS